MGMTPGVLHVLELHQVEIDGVCVLLLAVGAFQGEVVVFRRGQVEISHILELGIELQIEEHHYGIKSGYIKNNLYNNPFLIVIIKCQ